MTLKCTFLDRNRLFLGLAVLIFFGFRSKESMAWISFLIFLDNKGLKLSVQCKMTPMNYTICMGCLGKWLFCNARVCLCFYGQLGTLLWRLCCDISIIAILRSLACWPQCGRTLFKVAFTIILAKLTAFGS